MKLRQIAVAFASAVMFASLFAGSGLGMATAATMTGSQALTAHRAVVRQHAAIEGLRYRGGASSGDRRAGAFGPRRPLAWASSRAWWMELADGR